MEVSQMIKTNILSYILDEVALKCRNVSSNMRKRIHWMVKEKEITVRKYDERALILNGWIRLCKRAALISKVRRMKKGVSNYCLETQEQLDRILSFNDELRCNDIDFKLDKPIEVESIECLNVSEDKFDIFSKCYFNTVECLIVKYLSTDQIKFMLTRIKRVSQIQIRHSSLESIDFTHSRITDFFFEYVTFREPVHFPEKINKLALFVSNSINLVKAQRVNEIYINCEKNNLEEGKELLKTLKGVKVARLHRSFYKIAANLPSTVREIEIDKSWHSVENLYAIVRQFPCLIRTDNSFPIEMVIKINLRAINPIISQTFEKFSLRPRKITVNSENAYQLNRHPELFKKVEYLYVSDGSAFNFDVLSSQIKRIEIKYDIDEGSSSLNRLEKEPRKT